MNLHKNYINPNILFLSLLVLIIPLNAEDTLNNERLEFEDYLFLESPGIVIEASPIIESRSFYEIFPDLTQEQMTRVMSESGIRRSFESGGSAMILPHPDSGIDLLSGVLQKNPSLIVESLVLVPFNERELDMLDIYNSLRRIKEIKDQTIILNDGNTINLFEETTRLESAHSTRVIPDPAPADMLPYSETMYLRFTDVYIGHLFLRGNINISLYGLTYDMTNFRDIYFYIFRIMGTERASVKIYLEPVKEGILIYSMSGIYLPDFIASRIDLPANINARITVLLNWIIDGLRRQENRTDEREDEPPFNRIINF